MHVYQYFTGYPCESSVSRVAPLQQNRPLEEYRRLRQISADI